MADSLDNDALVDVALTMLENVVERLRTRHENHPDTVVYFHFTQMPEGSNPRHMKLELVLDITSLSRSN